jgi:AAA ATPase domain
LRARSPHVGRDPLTAVVALPTVAVMHLIERESELATLSTYLEDIRTGSGTLALVGGEAGAGKSALVSAFLDEVAVRIAAGSCDGLSTPRPLGPVIEIAAQLEVDSALPRDELFAAILVALEQQSTVVLVEDLHWADDATADFLFYAGRRLDRIPAMVVATYRDDELSSNGALTRLIGELSRLSAARRVPVVPLTRSGVATMVAGSGLDAEEVFRQTSGMRSLSPKCWRRAPAGQPAFVMWSWRGPRGCPRADAGFSTWPLSWASVSTLTFSSKQVTPMPTASTTASAAAR